MTMKRTITLATVFVLGVGASACEKSGKETQEKVDNAQATAQTEITNAKLKADEKTNEAERDFEKTRDDYRHDMQSNLASLDKKISDLDVKAVKATGDKKIDLNNRASALRNQRSTFAEDVRSIDTATAATWDATKARLDKEWSDIKSTTDKIVF